MTYPATPILLQGATLGGIATDPTPSLSLKHALWRVMHDVSAHGLRIDLPKPGACRMRDLVHRGAQRPVSKIMSVKLGRIVECESALEVDAVQILDAQGTVAAFCEQPLRIHYQHQGQARHHVPDLAVLSRGGRLSLLEVKFRSDVDSVVLDRTAHLQRSLGAAGLQYHLLTEHHIRQGDNVQRAIRVLRRARHGVCSTQVSAIWEKLSRLGRAPLSTFDWDVPGSSAACCIARLLVQGRASVDVSVALTGSTLVWASKGLAQEGVAW